MSALTSVLSVTLMVLALIQANAVQAAAPSDLQIFTSQDIAQCSGLSKTPSAPVDARTLPDDGSVWRVGTNRWTEALEKQYSDWILSDVNEEFFLNTHLSTDCADAPVALRLIFARIHHLPVFFKDSPISFTQSMKKWARLPTVRVWTLNNWRQSIRNDQRFIAFLAAVSDDIGTVNLAASTYPIQLRHPTRPERLSPNVSPGAVLLTSGHTRFISRIDTIGYTPIEQMASTVPSQVRTLQRGPITMWGLPDGQRQDGVLKFNWVVNCGGKTGFTHIPDERMPGYSLEQYRLREEFAERIDLNEFLLKLVPGVRKPYDNTYVDIRLQDLKTNITNRMALVNAAQEILAANPNAFQDPASRIYDDYSTHHRDEGIVKYFNDIQMQLYSTESAYLDAQAKKLIIPIPGGKRTSLYYFIRAVQARVASPEPSKSAEERWGHAYLETELERLQELKQELLVRIPEEKSDLGWWDRLQYRFGNLELRGEKQLRETDWDLKLVKRLLGNS